VDADGLPTLGQLPPTLLFHYEGEQTAVFESEITDHYIEDNSAIQDQIALKPTIVTTRGFIGELNNVLPTFLLPLQAAANALLTIDAYTPGLTTKALDDYNQALIGYETLSSVAKNAVAAIGSLASSLGLGSREIGTTDVFTVGASFNQNLQQKMFQQFYGYWASRTLFTIQTPWAIFQDMAIQSVKAIQDAETNVISTFEVTFKQIRTASTSLLSESSLISSGRAATQSADDTNLGTSSATGSVDQASAIP
jgi:hypothetical protein